LLISLQGVWHICYMQSKAGSYTDENTKMLKWHAGYAENEAHSFCPFKREKLAKVCKS